MVSYLDQIKEYFEGPIVRRCLPPSSSSMQGTDTNYTRLPHARQDFEGQRKAERYAQLILISSAVLGFLVGFALQDLRVTFGLFGTGFVGALFVSSLRPAKGSRA